MHMHFLRVVPVDDNRTERAGFRDLLHHALVRAELFEPVFVVMVGIMDRTTCFSNHAAQRDILERRAKAARRMPFDVGKIDQEAGILHHPRHFPGFHVLVFPLVCVVILLIDPSAGIDRAVQHFAGIPACRAAFHIPIHIDDKGFAAPRFDRLHDLAHKDRVNRGIPDIVANVQFETYCFILDPVAQVQQVQDQIKFGW